MESADDAAGISHAPAGVRIVALVARPHEPSQARARTREGQRPAGYGVREQCLPYTAAASIGFLIPAPFGWGSSYSEEAPQGARPFKSPVRGENGQKLSFYVIDDPARSFVGNEYLVPADVEERIGSAPFPGLSFFSRPDQQHFVKVHLPYIWRTAPNVAVLVTDPVNRPRRDGLRVVAGLVETGWYSNPVNLVLELPGHDVHIEAGSPLAHAVLIDETQRRPEIELLEPHSREARDILGGMKAWRRLHAEDRSAYRHLARRRGDGKKARMDRA